ncbi:uncharacterized protein LOC143228924 isoform X1 [Tachypleus tridentatus]|uniref:uncharacterized protein LOC143228924 isoform X1 n=1 Tax=Tachypleus tridentatus TaxID=6853 RepID=UPI003FD49965
MKFLLLKWLHGQIEEVGQLQMSFMRSLSPSSKRHHQCNICLKNFTRRQHLKRHQEIHFQQRVYYQCEFCPCSYSRKDNLLVHVRMVHKLPTARH